MKALFKCFIYCYIPSQNRKFIHKAANLLPWDVKFLYAARPNIVARAPPPPIYIVVSSKRKKKRRKKAEKGGKGGKGRKKAEKGGKEAKEAKEGTVGVDSQIET